VPQAVSLRCPVLVFPVDDLDSCVSAGRVAQQLDHAVPGLVGATSAPFRDCILVRPGSTLSDIYQVLQHSGFIGQDRDLVRAERLMLSDCFEGQSVMTNKARSPVKRGDILSDSVVLKVFTNARKEWQRRFNAK
jgi:hypothetical protein